MGVSIAHYRQAIGIFNSNCAQSNNKLYCARDLYQKAKLCEGKFDTRNPLDIFLHYIYCIAIFYIFIFMEMYMLSTVPSSKTQEQIFYESDDNFETIRLLMQPTITSFYTAIICILFYSLT